MPLLLIQKKIFLVNQEIFLDGKEMYKENIFYRLTCKFMCINV